MKKEELKSEIDHYLDLRFGKSRVSLCNILNKAGIPCEIELYLLDIKTGTMKKKSNLKRLIDGYKM